MDRRPAPGEKYRHFKNKDYEVIGVAKHSETGEELVVYKQLYGAGELYVRPLEMFTSEVDHVKYPDVKQKWRFERVINGRTESEGDVAKDSDEVPAGLMAFLDADTFEERYNILVTLQDEVTDQMIDSMAVVCDLVIPEGEIMKRFEDLKHAIATRQQYEDAGRLR